MRVTADWPMAAKHAQVKGTAERRSFMPDLLVHCLIIGVLGGIVSQFGDLTASIFKRKMGIKDYGHLIPGHGGILDRFDSVLFTGPMVYYYIVLVIGYMP